ncbi:MAG: amino acid ABC transporter ATP-binding protein [Desulfohalobiaceae bacterium]|nr:amino acid ABC transporter ATP-binding protein [Desulfohalobiaceae bacterium]
MQPILSAENIHIKLGGQEIVKGVSLSVEQREIKVLIGPSGAGKSTFLQSLNFLVLPEQGSVSLEGHPVNPENKKELYAHRQQVGMIFQDFNLFDHLTALDNTAVGLIRVKGLKKKQARERGMAELARVGLEKQAGQYPAELSGGQKQRVSIARSLTMDPKVMLLDEPTSALDPELIGGVHGVIKDLAEAGMTMLIVTHQLYFASSLANEIVFMENGKILEQGQPEKILNQAEHARTREFCSKITKMGTSG